jgi:hypothetical protein
MERRVRTSDYPPFLLLNFSTRSYADLHIESSGKLGREERYRTVISGMEPRRIAEVMLLPRVRTIDAPKIWHQLFRCQ